MNGSPTVRSGNPVVETWRWPASSGTVLGRDRQLSPRRPSVAPVSENTHASDGTVTDGNADWSVPKR